MDKYNVKKYFLVTLIALPLLAMEEKSNYLEQITALARANNDGDLVSYITRRQKKREAEKAYRALVSQSENLASAISEGNSEKVKLLLDQGADLKESRRVNPLILAIEHNQPSILKLLLEKGGDVNMPIHGILGRTAFQQAVLGENLGAVKIMLESGKVDLNLKDPNSDKAPLQMAIEANNNPMVQLLLEHGAGK